MPPKKLDKLLDALQVQFPDEGPRPSYATTASDGQGPYSEPVPTTTGRISNWFNQRDGPSQQRASSNRRKSASRDPSQRRDSKSKSQSNPFQQVAEALQELKVAQQQARTASWWYFSVVVVFAVLCALHTFRLNASLISIIPVHHLPGFKLLLEETLLILFFLDGFMCSVIFTGLLLVLFTRRSRVHHGLLWSSSSTFILYVVVSLFGGIPLCAWSCLSSLADILPSLLNYFAQLMRCGLFISLVTVLFLIRYLNLGVFMISFLVDSGVEVRQLRHEKKLKMLALVFGLFLLSLSGATTFNDKFCRFPHITTVSPTSSSSETSNGNKFEAQADFTANDNDSTTGGIAKQREKRIDSLDFRSMQQEGLRSNTATQWYEE